MQRERERERERDYLGVILQVFSNDFRGNRFTKAEHNSKNLVCYYSSKSSIYRMGCISKTTTPSLAMPSERDYMIRGPRGGY